VQFFRGSPKASIKFIFSFFIKFLSIPNGFDAKSIINASFLTFFNSSSFSIIFGIVLIIISYFLNISFLSLIFSKVFISYPYAFPHASSILFVGITVVFKLKDCILYDNIFPILPNPIIRHLEFCIIFLVFSIIIFIVASAVGTVFNIANSSFFSMSKNFIFSLSNFSLISFEILPVKIVFPFILFIISSISNFSSESGVLILLSSFEKGKAVIIISVSFIPWSKFSHCIICWLKSFSKNPFSKP